MFGSPRDNQLRVARKYSDKHKTNDKYKFLTVNYMKELLSRKGCLASIISYLEISTCIQLKIICSAKSI